MQNKTGNLVGVNNFAYKIEQHQEQRHCNWKRKIVERIKQYDAQKLLAFLLQMKVVNDMVTDTKLILFK